MVKKSRTKLHDHRPPALRGSPGAGPTTPSTPQHMPLQKTIGQAKPEIVPSLIVMNARGASLQGANSHSPEWRPTRSFSRTARCGRQGIRSRPTCWRNGRQQCQR